ncbi:MAG: CRISPR-associated endonuclease Cas1 [Eubacteriaceae bacterium]|nr:CRISPR-associated endonuclease Cas1 [Eubacteriaceae bacterium]
MRKLLNTIYVTDEKAFLGLEGETLVHNLEGKKTRIPFDNIESIVCMNYVGCSPALMGKCVSRSVPINFVSPSGKFWAKVCGETKGNVFLRVQQIDTFRDKGLNYAKSVLAAKCFNTKQLIKQYMSSRPDLKDNHQVRQTLAILEDSIEKIENSMTVDVLLGIEGNCAKAYFSVFNILMNNEGFSFVHRNKRPPLDPVNAMLSFVYTLLMSDYASALETVGLDSYIGFYHTLRSGRCSLACDLMEETRCLVERFVLSMIHLKMVNQKDFEKQISGAIWLNDQGRKKVITRWQERKRKTMLHPFLNEKIPWGLLPYVQSNLLAKAVRGELENYPAFLLKG